jgi:outer membrane protein OmpA-like peptidoglycan-associated protein
MKKTFLIIFNLVLTCSIFAQQDSYKWRVGLHGGIMSYYGDLSNSYFDAQHPFVNPTDNLDYLSYALSIENNFSKTFSWKLQASQGQFQAYDRSIDFDGNTLSNINANRAINVQTDITNLAFTLNFYTDNDWLFSQKAWVSPYFSIGAGITRFTPYGDLFLENGNRYYYWSDGTVRDDAETNSSANIIEQDLIFETNLANVQAEQADYRNTTLSFPLGLGLKFRISDRINVNAEVIGQYTLTDYLDDVSATYPTNYDNPLQAYASLPGTSSSTNRGNTDNNLNDIFGMASISLHYSFGYKMESFLPPSLYTIGATEQPAIVSNPNQTEVEVEEETTSNSQENKATEIEIEEDIKNEVKKAETVQDDNQQDRNTTQEENGVVKVDTVLEKKIITVIKEEITEEKIITEEIKLSEKELEKKGIEVVDLDGNPIEPDTTSQLITIPANTGLNTIPNDDVDTVVTKTDVSIFEAIKTQVDSVAAKPLETTKPALDLSDIDLTNDDGTVTIPVSEKEQDTELLLNIEETRSDVLKLTSEFNKLLIARKTDQEEIRTVNAKLDSLTKMLTNAQQFNNNITVKANDDVAQADKVAIQTATTELEKELEAIKAQLNRANSDYEKAVIYANQQQKDSQKKNLELDRKVKLLKAELKAEKQKRKKAERKARLTNSTNTVANPSRVKKDTDNLNTGLTPTIDTIIQIDTIDNTDDNLLAVLDSLVAEVEAAQAKEITNKENEVNDLKKKLAEIELKLEASQKEKVAVVVPNEKDDKAMKALEAKIDQLTTKISDMEKVEPKVITVERIVEAKPVEVKSAEVPRSEQIAKAIKGTEISNVYFKVGKSTVDREFYQRLERITNLMLLYPELNATITGYADKSGNPEINFKLSRQRSEAVKTFLLQQGIRQDRLDVNYLGETKATQANDPYSRRVEIQLIY